MSEIVTKDVKYFTARQVNNEVKKYLLKLKKKLKKGKSAPQKMMQENTIQIHSEVFKNKDRYNFTF